MYHFPDHDGHRRSRKKKLPLFIQRGRLHLLLQTQPKMVNDPQAKWIGQKVIAHSICLMDSIVECQDQQYFRDRRR
jgi:hypothetical protein